MCMHLSGNGYMVPFSEKVNFYQERPSEVPSTGSWFAETREQSTTARSLCEKPSVKEWG